MSTIKLFSGMDFSGKSTTIRSIDTAMPNVFTCRKKFITPIDKLQAMIDKNIWIPPNEFIPLLQNMVKDDINNFQVAGPILQDTLWIIKFTARLIAENNIFYHNEINELLDLIGRYPDMDSFYITTSREERIKRYELRVSNGKRISRSDKLLFNSEIFEKTEKNYIKILFDRFPNTKIIDTTFNSPEKIVEQLVTDYFFLKDL